jgi:hypothetical protein
VTFVFSLSFATESTEKKKHRGTPTAHEELRRFNQGAALRRQLAK